MVVHIFKSNIYIFGIYIVQYRDSYNNMFNYVHDVSFNPI